MQNVYYPHYSLSKVALEALFHFSNIIKLSSDVAD